MAFTQENETNLNPNTRTTVVPHCNGCDARCKFGVHYFYRVNRVNPLCSGNMACPTIGSQQIKTYKTPHGQTVDAILRIPDNVLDAVEVTRLQAIEQARIIATLCDHYKTR